MYYYEAFQFEKKKIFLQIETSVILINLVIE